MSDIPERLKEGARRLFYGLPMNKRPSADEIAAWGHEIEQAARAEGERAGIVQGIEMAASLHDADAKHYTDIALRKGLENHDVAGQVRYERLAEIEHGHAARIRSLPTTAEPAKEA